MNRKVLDLVAGLLRSADAEFPNSAVTTYLVDAFQAEFGGAGDIDLRGTASRHWAESPRAVTLPPGRFHAHAVGHPLVLVYRSTGAHVPLRISDVAPAGTAPRVHDEPGMSRVMTIPLSVTPAHVCAVALTRDGADFTAGDMLLAGRLQPVLGGLYALRAHLDSTADGSPASGSPASGSSARVHLGMAEDADISLTERELAVLDLMGGGLIAEAIARHLGISPRTVGKHIEHIYRKLGSQDRTSAVLRAQALGFLPPPQPR